MKPVWNVKGKSSLNQEFDYVRLPNPIQISRVIRARLSSIEQLFDFRTFDCVRLMKSLGEFDYVRLPNPIEINRTIGVGLSSITERSIDYAGHTIWSISFVDFPQSTRQRMHYVGLSRVKNSSALHILNLNEKKKYVSESSRHHFQVQKDKK